MHQLVGAGWLFCSIMTTHQLRDSCCLHREEVKHTSRALLQHGFLSLNLFSFISRYIESTSSPVPAMTSHPPSASVPSSPQSNETKGEKWLQIQKENISSPSATTEAYQKIICFPSSQMILCQRQQMKALELEIKHCLKLWKDHMLSK
jgi:hypothetical protein